MPKAYLRLHFTLQHRFVAFFGRLLDSITYTARHGLIKGMRRKGGLAFLPAFLTRAYENTPELKFMSGIKIENAIVYDLGAFQGIFTLFFSRQARHVFAYEPNPRSHSRMLENIRLNNIHNVIVRNVAVGDRQGSITLIFDRRMAGAASGDPSVSGQIAETSKPKVRIYR